MDAHVKVCEELFSACKTEFKHLEYFYFHNCVYESVWKNNLPHLRTHLHPGPAAQVRPGLQGGVRRRRRHGPYEITQAAASSTGTEPGYVWIKRFMEKYKKLIWINPYPKDTWNYTASTNIMRDEDQMYPLTLSGLEEE